MPQDVDDTGWISLVWLACIYWNLYWCLERMGSLEQAGKADGTGEAAAVAAPAKGQRPARAKAMPPALARRVDEILRQDASAGVDAFLQERLAHYEAVVAAFDAGNRELLRGLVSSEVYEIFRAAIDVRKIRGQRIETAFAWIEPSEIVEARIDAEQMDIAIRFTGAYFEFARDSIGLLTKGTPAMRRSSDVWTFARDLTQAEKTWRVVATEAES
jgi:predicted lipid-binding transport protein (Tim44 family)